MRTLSTLVQHEQPNQIYLRRTVLVHEPKGLCNSGYDFGINSIDYLKLITNC